VRGHRNVTLPADDSKSKEAAGGRIKIEEAAEPPAPLQRDDHAAKAAEVALELLAVVVSVGCRRGRQSPSSPGCRRGRCRRRPAAELFSRMSCASAWRRDIRSLMDERSSAASMPPLLPSASYRRNISSWTTELELEQHGVDESAIIYMPPAV
jgi:hypothetical protein